MKATETYYQNKIAQLEEVIGDLKRQLAFYENKIERLKVLFGISDEQI